MFVFTRRGAMRPRNGTAPAQLLGDRNWRAKLAVSPGRRRQAGGPRGGWAAIACAVESLEQRRLMSSVAFDSPFEVVNSHLPGAQSSPDVAVDDEGNYVVVWESQNQVAADSGYDIYGQRFNASGEPLGGEFLINTFTSFDQKDPAVAMDADGDFVVTWSGYGLLEPDEVFADGTGVFARRFDSSGVALGDAFIVNTTIVGNQTSPAIAADDGGNFTVVWTGTAGINARRYSADGNALSGELTVSSFVGGTSSRPSVAVNDAGLTAVAWSGSGADGTGVYARRFDGDGVPLGDDILVAALPTGITPAVGIDAAGGFAVAFADGTLGSSESYVRRFDSTGQSVGGLTPVSLTTPTFRFDSIDLAMSDDGLFVVAWSSIVGEGARIFDSAGVAQTGNVGLGETTDLLSLPLSIALSPGLDLIAVANSGSSSSSDVKAQRLRIVDIDRDDTLSTANDAGSLVVGGSIQIGGINGVDAGVNVGSQDVDLFRIDVTEAGLLRLSASASPMTSRLFDAAGVALTSGLTAHVLPGTYYLGVSAQFNNRYDPNIRESSTDLSYTAGGEYSITVSLETNLAPTADSVTVFETRPVVDSVITLQVNGIIDPNAGESLTPEVFVESNGTPGLQVGEDDLLASGLFSTSGLTAGEELTFYGRAIDSGGNVSNTVETTVVLSENPTPPTSGVIRIDSGSLSPTTSGGVLIAGNDAGRHVVVWPAGSSIRVRIYGADGSPVGDELTVPHPPGTTPISIYAMTQPEVAMAGDGSFVITYRLLDRAYAQRFTADGTPAGLIDIDPGGKFATAVGVDVALRDDGLLVVAGTKSVGGSFVWVFNSDGSLRGQVSVGTTDRVEVVLLDDDTAGVVAVDDGVTTAMPLDLAVVTTGASVLVSASTLANSAAVTADGSGGFAVATVSPERSLVVQRYDASFAPIGAPAVLAGPVVAVLSGSRIQSISIDSFDDGYMLAFRASLGTYAQRLSPELERVGGEFRVLPGEGDGVTPVVTVDDAGRVVIAWRGSNPSGVFLRRFEVARLAGDVNGDEQVDMDDLGLLLEAYGSADDLRADFDGDGVVGFADLGLLLGRFGENRIVASAAPTFAASWADASGDHDEPGAQSRTGVFSEEPILLSA